MSDADLRAIARQAQDPNDLLSVRRFADRKKRAGLELLPDIRRGHPWHFKWIYFWSGFAILIDDAKGGPGSALRYHPGHGAAWVPRRMAEVLSRIDATIPRPPLDARVCLIDAALGSFEVSRPIPQRPWIDSLSGRDAPQGRGSMSRPAP